MKNFILSFILLALCQSSYSQSVPFYVPTNGLVGWWPFNGNANDESGNGNNGVVNGASLTTDRNGNSNSAFDFNGNGNYISVASSPSIESGKITVSVWYNTTSNDLLQMLLGKSEFNNAQHEMYSFHLRLAAIKRNSACVNGDGWFIDTLQASINLNQWQHAVFTYDSLVIKTYLNGVLVNQNSNVPAGWIDLCSGGTLRFGAWWLNDPRWFHGKLDDIGIWNRALTAQEISSLYHSGVVPPTTLTTAGITSTGATCNWTAVTGATKYQFRYRKDSIPALAWITSNVTTTNKTLSFLNKNTKHKWSVRSFVNGSWSSWGTPIKSFKTKATPRFGLEENDENSISIYPNPNDGNFKIDFGESFNGEKYSIVIRNALSQIIFKTETDEQKVEINLDGVAEKGVYLLEIRGVGKTYWGRLIHR